ncbi:two-partner secretion domain-containing protein [Chromohalobacter israelensis]|uniref:two-partner secretion domain-containing protein n=1 Tax=Chromohalobacter israelensis TaxID=141390 RepID=UPI00265B7EBC|nr:hemagglutinin repeat-containing protein [Chromohalobacter salexigens]MDO0945660.1 hemagglutinin repeat-containing protein [Chromohalobacter salexigens]
MNARSNGFRYLAIILINALFWHPVVVLADGIAVSPGGGNTHLDQAGNGVPVIDIATPNGKGLSHNTFSDYNVDKRGLILNNATTKWQDTQLAGKIVGNPNLRDRAASLIINEVNGGNPSRLAGYTEVAGRQASVVVANPYGITCDGCGFINSPRATLTTGKPIIESGELDHFAVEQGQVAIEGLGLDATQVDQFDILTRAAEVNAEIHAKRLNVVTGVNDIDADSLVASPREGQGKAPELAIDSSALGGMYADRISLVGTEAGVGVKLAGDMAANAGDILIDAAGHLELSDTAAARHLDVRAASIDAEGQLRGEQRLAIDATGDMALYSNVSSAGDISLEAGGKITQQGQVIAGVEDSQRLEGRRLTVRADRIDNHGRLDATQQLKIDGRVASNHGQLLANEIAVTTRDAIDNIATIQGRRVSLDTASLHNDQADATIAAERSLDLRAPRIVNRGGLRFGSGQDVILDIDSLDNQEGRFLLDDGDLDLKAVELVNDDGVIHADGLSMAGQTLSNRNDGLIDASAGGAKLDFDRQIDNSSGQLQATGDLHLTGGDVSNRSGKILADALTLEGDSLDNRSGELLGRSADVSIKQSLDNTEGRLAATTETLTLDVGGDLGNSRGVLRGHDAHLEVGALTTNQNGLVSAEAGDLQLIAHDVLNNAGGIIAADMVQLAGRAFDNTRGIVSAAQGPLSLHIQKRVDNRDGAFQAGDGDSGRLVLAAGSVDNRKGQMVGGVLDLGTQGKWDNRQGELTADQGKLNLNVANGEAFLNRGGQLQAVGPISLETGQLDNTHGVLLSDTLRVHSDELNNIEGVLSSFGELELRVSRSIDNSGGRILSQNGTVDIRQPKTLINTDGLVSAPHLELMMDDLDNSNGRLQADGRIEVQTGTFDNTEGVLLADGVRLASNGFVNDQGAILGGTDGVTLKLNGLGDNRRGVIDAQDGTLQVLSDDQMLDNRDGSLSGRQLTLSVDRLDNRTNGQIAGRRIELDGLSRLDNRSGRIIADNGALMLGAAAIDNRGGLIQGDSVSLQGDRLDNGNGGLLASLQGLLKVVLGERLTNVAGRILANGMLDIDPPLVDNTDGQIAGDEVTLTAGRLVNTRGIVEAQNQIRINAGSITNGNGNLRSLGGKRSALKVETTLDNRSGEIGIGSHDFQLEAGYLLNSLGTVLHAGKGLFTLQADSLNNRDGALQGTSSGSFDIDQLAGMGRWQFNDALALETEGRLELDSDERIASAGDLTLAAMGIDNGGELLANSDLALISRNDLVNSGTISSQSALNIVAHNLSQKDGRLASGGDATYRLTGGLDNLGRLVAGGNIDLQASDINNRGTLGSQQDLRVVSQGGIDNNADTLLFSGGDMTLRGKRLTNVFGDIYSRGSFDFALDDQQNFADRLENRSGNIEAEGDIGLNVGVLLNAKDVLETQKSFLSRHVESKYYVANKKRTYMGRNNKNQNWPTASVPVFRETFQDYELTEVSKEYVTADSPAAYIASMENIDVAANEVINDSGIISAGHDLSISAETLKNLGKPAYETTRYRIYTGQPDDLSDYSVREVDNLQVAYDEDLKKLKRLSNSQNKDARYSAENAYERLRNQGRPDDSIDSQKILEWNQKNGLDKNNNPIDVPNEVRQKPLKSDVTVKESNGTLSPAKIQSGGTVSIHSAESIGNGAVEESQSAKLQRKDATIDIDGVVSTVDISLGQRKAAHPERSKPTLDASHARRELDATGSGSDFRDTGTLRGNGNRASVGRQKNFSVDIDQSVGMPSRVSQGNDSASGGTKIATRPLAEVGFAPVDYHGMEFERVSPISLSSFRLPKGNYGLFVKSAAPKSHYLIETNPEFTAVENVIGSDYLLDKIDYSDDSAYQLLGDGRYESHLIRDAIQASTGNRFLDERLDNDYQQYRYLMDNAIAAQDALQLTVGVGLTPEQTAALTHDIVWLESQEIDGETVLVPVLYLAQVDERNVHGSNLIQGRGIELIAGGDLINVGTIKVANDLTMNSGGSILQGGLVEAENRLDMSAVDDIRNAVAGEIRGRNVSLKTLKGDIVNDRTAITAGYDKSYQTYLDAGGLIFSQEDLRLDAGRDLINRSEILSLGAIEANAGRDILLDAVEDTWKEDTAYGAGRIETATTHLGSSLEAANDLALTAGGDISILGSRVSTGEALGLWSGDDITVSALEDSYHHIDTGSGGRKLAKKSTTSQTASKLLSDGRAVLAAGRDIDISASRLDSGADLGLTAANDVRIVAGEQNRGTESAVFSHRKTSERIEQVVSRIDATGDLTVAAGRDIDMVASRLESGESLRLSAGHDLTLNSAADSLEQNYRSSSTKKIHREIRQQGSELRADDDLTLVAGSDVNVTAGRLEAGDQAYLFAGRDVNLLAATDQDYSLYEKEKDGGLFGSSSYRRDEVDDRRAVGSQIVGGDGLSVFSGGDQTYQGARLESGGDLALTSLGSIDFATASDLHSESYEKSSGNFAWQSSKGEGRTDETLRQSELIARGETLIQAANGLNIDVSRIDQQTVSQTIDAMVAADPDFAWLKDMEARGDVDWHQVKAIHDSWDYSQSGLSQVAALAVSITVAAMTSGAAMSGTAAGAGATSATSMWAAATETVAAGWANAAMSGAIAGAAGSAVGAASQGIDWQKPALHGAITGGLANYLAAGTYYHNPLSKMTDLGQQLSQGALLDAGKVVGGLVMQKTWNRIAEKMAKGVGLSEEELNWVLMASSIAGDQLPGIGNRYKSDDREFTLTYSNGARGFMDSGLPGVPFNVIDTALGYQGLPDTSVRAYLMNQGFEGKLTGHSLGTLTANYLAGNGLADHAELFSLPFGNIAAPNARLTIGSGDLINGGYLGKVFNPDAIVAPITPLQHPFENYKAFIDAHPELYSTNN